MRPLLPLFLLVASCRAQRQLTPDGLCADIGYALSARTWDCTGDADEANALYEELFEYAECRVVDYTQDIDSGWLGEERGETYFINSFGESITVGEAYACPAAAQSINCAATASARDALAALVEVEPLCSRVLGAKDLAAELPGGCAVILYRDREYAYCLNEKTWTDAREDCLSKGMDLVSFRDGTEQGDIWAMSLGYGGGRWWLGLTDADNEGDWRWSEGAPISNYVNWASGQPDSGTGDEDCGAASASEQGWHDLPCSTKLPYICED